MLNAVPIYVSMQVNITLFAPIAAVKAKFGYHLIRNVKPAPLVQPMLLGFVSVRTASLGLAQLIPARQEVLISQAVLEN